MGLALVGQHVHDPATLAAKAKRAADLVVGHPQLAASQAEAVARRARADSDHSALASAEHTLALVARQAGDLRSAEAHLVAAIASAGRAGDDHIEGRARLSLVPLLLMAGRSEDALAEADRAAGLVEAGDAPRVVAQRSLVLQRLGRDDEALAGYAEALTAWGSSADGAASDRATVLRNRAILRTYRRDLEGAETDLRAAEALYTSAGAELAVAEVRHNLGFVMAQRGDIPAALRRYEEAGATFAHLGVRRPAALLDRCQALMSVGLASDAYALAHTAATQLASAGNELDLAEARIVLSEAAMICGETGEAIEVAALARLALVHQQRPAWAALARYQFLRAAWYAGLSPSNPADVRAAADELEATGWSVHAADARVLAARLAIEAGQDSAAEADLGRVAAHGRRAPAELRARAWHARALLRVSRGERRGALTALRRGVEILEEGRAGLGATELRAHASASAVELVTLGLGLALDSRRPATVLAWAERARAASLRLPPARPPADVDLAHDLASLRQLSSELREATLAEVPTAQLRRQIFHQERVIRDRSLTVPAGAASSWRPPPPPTVAALVSALGEQALVEYVAFAGQMWAVSVAGGRPRLVGLGPVAGVREEIDQLRFALSRLVAARSRPALLDAAARSFSYASTRLDGMLLGPLRRVTEERPLVVVPTGALHALPWGLLPSCAGRAVSVAPSAGLWLAAHRPQRPPIRVAALVAGPGIEAGPGEVSALAPLYGEAISLVDGGATVAEALRALPLGDIGHIAAHGTFRADNPLFSSLELADGPLTVYDLESAGRVPPVIVLSACEGARAAVTQGDELMGLAAALLGLGASTVVASPVPVPDQATRALMVDFHSRLRHLPPAAALAEAQAALRQESAGSGSDLWPADPQAGAALAGAGSFSCFGAG